MLTKKTLTRRFLVQFFYQLFFSAQIDSVKKSLKTSFFSFKESLENSELNEDGLDFKGLNEGFAIEIIETFEKRVEEINEKISQNATEYPFEKIPFVDRAILTIAICEMIFISEPTPFKVVTDEAIELSKFFKDESSAGFVNGVLAKIIDEEKLEEKS
ncbi:MAG: hypothetical protein Fur0024_5430 [Patescibacteria group bacterium]